MAKANIYPQQNQVLLLLLWSIWFCREVFCFCREVFGFVFAVRRWRAKVALWQDICLLFVLSLCDFCSPARWFCITWRLSRECLADVTDMRRCAKLRSTLFSRRVVRPHGSMLWYYPFVHNCSTSYLTKCSEPKEFYLSRHFCVFLVLFRLLARVRATRPWKTHFSHLVTVRKSTLRTRVAPTMFVFLLEKE